MARRIVILLTAFMVLAAEGVVTNLHTGMDWQSTIQSFTGVNTGIFAAGIYSVTNELVVPANTWLVGNTTNRSIYGVTSNGASEVILSGSGTCRVLRAAAAWVYLDGITVANGHATVGGGLFSANYAAYIKATNCYVVSNVAYAVNGYGGGANGVHFFNSTIRYCAQTNGVGGYGGGMRYGSLSNCVVRDCWAAGYGGGVSANALSVYDSQITSNSARWGGGVYAPTRIVNSVIASNYSTLSGGGVFSGGGITNCVIEYNRASTEGGGTANASLIACVLRFNACGTYGGGALQSRVERSLIVSNYGAYGAAISGVKLTNSVVAYNYATNNGVVGYVSWGNDTYLDNCYVFANRGAGTGSAFFNVWRLSGCTITGHTNASYIGQLNGNTWPGFNNLIVGNYSNSIAGSTNVGNNWTTDVECVSGVAPMTMWGMEIPAYVTTDTNVVDMANATYTLVSSDIRGLPRVSGVAADIGAFEYTSTNDIPVASGRRRLIWSLIR